MPHPAHTGTMCGRFARERDDYAARFCFQQESETRIVPRFNIDPTPLGLLVRPEGDGRRLVASRLGLLPVWAKDRTIASKVLNALIERRRHGGSRAVGATMGPPTC